MELDGADATGPMDVPNTGSWGTFRWMESAGVSLTAGGHVLRIAADQQYFNLDALGIVDAQSAVSAAGDVAATLRVGRAADGSITLSWGGSCAAGDDDYEVYAGTIGAFGSYVSRLCTTGGLTTASLPALPQDEYYLVVPRNPRRERS